jgi:hypothetical protein
MGGMLAGVLHSSVVRMNMDREGLAVAVKVGEIEALGIKDE